MRVDRSTVVAIVIGLVILAGIVGFSLLDTDTAEPVATEGAAAEPTVSACREWQLTLASSDPGSTLDDVDEAISYGRTYAAETSETAMDSFRDYVDPTVVERLDDWVEQAAGVAATPGLDDEEYHSYLVVVQRSRGLAGQVDDNLGTIGTLAQMVLNVRQAIGDTTELCSDSTG